MIMTKITYVQALDEAIAVFNQRGVDSEEVKIVDPEEVEIVEKLTALRDNLAKRKNYKSNKPTKRQSENAELAEKIAEFIAENGAVTCGQVEEAFGINNQRASAILNRNAKFVKVTEAKGKVKATFGLAE